MNGLEMRYFILKPVSDSEHGFASRMALLRYAACIEPLQPELAQDIREWVSKIQLDLGVFNE